LPFGGLPFGLAQQNAQPPKAVKGGLPFTLPLTAFGVLCHHNGQTEREQHILIFQYKFYINFTNNAV
jgi:hypothetical protein